MGWRPACPARLHNVLTGPTAQQVSEGLSIVMGVRFVLAPFRAPPLPGWHVGALLNNPRGVGISDHCVRVPESACVPVPSEVTLLRRVSAVSQGWMSLALAVLAATAGNLPEALQPVATGGVHRPIDG